MGQSIKGLLFDKDGTLFDFNATWGAWAEQFFEGLTGDRGLAEKLGANLGFDLCERRFDPDSVIVAGTPEEIAHGILEHLPNWQMDELIAFMNKVAQDVPQAEVVPLQPFLKGLMPAYKLGVATNDAEAPARAHLDQARVTHLFDFIAGYDSGFGGKPKPGMQQAFCAQLGLEPDQVVMVGDATHDLIAGREAGMVTIGVLTGLAPETELSPYADAVLESIKDLPDWLSSRET